MEETNYTAPAEKSKRGRPRKDEPAPIVDWLDVMTAARSDTRLATRVWFPEPRGDHFELNDGINCAVLIGEPAYQVSSGEIVAL